MSWRSMRASRPIRARTSGAPHQVVTVPRTAVTYSLYGDNVWLVEKKKAAKPAEATAGGGDTEKQAPQTIAVRRFVRVGPVQGDRVAITEGVKPGDEVVTSGQLKLQPNGAIKIDNAGRLKAPPVLPRT